MSKDQTRELEKFLKPFDKDIIEIVMGLREFIWDLYPQTNELIYDNYNALAIGWSPTNKAGHTFCSIAVWRTNKKIHFGFYWGSELSDPDGILKGQGSQYRYIVVTDKKIFPKMYVKKLIKEAYGNSFRKIKNEKQILHGKTIVKSISEKKRKKKVKPKP